MGVSYEFRFAKGRIYLNERSWEGVGTPEHNTVMSTEHIKEAEGIYESLEVAISQYRIYDRGRKSEEVKALRMEVEKKKAELEALERQMLNYEKSIVSSEHIDDKELNKLGR